MELLNNVIQKSEKLQPAINRLKENEAAMPDAEREYGLPIYNMNPRGYNNYVCTTSII
jgi:hypothetical protein